MKRCFSETTEPRGSGRTRFCVFLWRCCSFFCEWKNRKMWHNHRCIFASHCCLFLSSSMPLQRPETARWAKSPPWFPDTWRRSPCRRGPSAAPESKLRAGGQRGRSTTRRQTHPEQLQLWMTASDMLSINQLRSHDPDWWFLIISVSRFSAVCTDFLHTDAHNTNNLWCKCVELPPASSSQFSSASFVRGESSRSRQRRWKPDHQFSSRGTDQSGSIFKTLLTKLHHIVHSCSFPVTLLCFLIKKTE